MFKIYRKPEGLEVTYPFFLPCCHFFEYFLEYFETFLSIYLESRNHGQGLEVSKKDMCI